VGRDRGAVCAKVETLRRRSRARSVGYVESGSGGASYKLPQPKAIFFAFEACKMSHLVMLNVTFVAHVNWSFSELVKCSNYITA